MNYYAFSALVVFLSCVLCGLFVFWKNPRGQKNLVYLPFAASIGLWAFFYMLWQMSTNEVDALRYIRISIAFAALIPVSNFHAIIKMLDLETPLRRRFTKIFYATSTLIVLSSPTRYFIPGVVPRDGFPFWPLPGPMIHVHFINLFIPPIWLTYLLWKEKERASPLQKNKLKWLFYGHLVAYVGGCSNNFLWYNIPIKPYLSILSSFALITTAVTYFRPAIVDFNFLIRRIFFITTQFLLSCLIPTLMLMPLFDRLKPIFLVSIGAILGAILHPLIHKFMRPSTSLLKVNREKIKESTFTYQDLARNIVDLTMSTVPVEMVGIYFYDLATKDFYLCAQKGMKNRLTGNLRYNRSALAISPSDPLLERVASDHRALYRELLINDLREADRPVIEGMQRLEAEICEPFIFGEKLRGLMVVGRKRNNSLFNEDELDLIRSYSQMGIEVMRTIMAMETELNQTALYSHDINHDIRSITQTMQFLRSPMAKTVPEEKHRALLEQGENVAERLYDWFQANRDRSSMIMKTIRGEYEKKLLDVSEFVKISAGKFFIQAESAHVEYIVDVQPSPQKILGNEVDLTRAVDNLISNGLRHLPPTGGRIEVKGRLDGANFEILIRDNGEGVAPENLPRIWQFGWQGQDSKKGSAGFGLAITKQIVQIHGGTIEAASQGKGTGMEFKIVLPVQTNPASSNDLEN